MGNESSDYRAIRKRGQKEKTITVMKRYTNYVNYWGSPINPINYKLYAYNTCMPCFHQEERLFTKEEFDIMIETNENFKTLFK